MISLKTTFAICNTALAITALAVAISGCANNGISYGGMSSNQTTSLAKDFMGMSPYRAQGLGQAVSLNLGTDLNSLPSGTIFPAMKGKWAGVMENNDRTHTTRKVMIYISASTKKAGLKQEDLNILAVAPAGCTLGFVYLTTQPDGTVIYKKMTSWNGYQDVCGSGFLRVKPQDDGTLRISDHLLTAEGKETSAGVFARAPQ